MYSGYYGTFVAHIFSLIASFWSIHALQKCKQSNFYVLSLLVSALLSVSVNSILCLLRYGLTEGYKLKKLHVVSVNISTICFFSFIYSSLLLVAKISTMCYFLPLLNLIPFYSNVKKLDYRSKRCKSDCIIFFNCLVFLCIAIYSENYHAVSFILSFTFGYFYVGDCGYFFDTEVPSIDIYQYIQCFLCMFAVCALYE